MINTSKELPVPANIWTNNFFFVYVRSYDWKICCNFPLLDLFDRPKKVYHLIQTDCEKRRKKIKIEATEVLANSKQHFIWFHNFGFFSLCHQSPSLSFTLCATLLSDFSPGRIFIRSFAYALFPSLSRALCSTRSRFPCRCVQALLIPWRKWANFVILNFFLGSNQTHYSKPLTWAIDSIFVMWIIHVTCMKRLFLKRKTSIPNVYKTDEKKNFRHF